MNFNHLDHKTLATFAAMNTLSIDQLATVTGAISPAEKRETLRSSGEGIRRLVAKRLASASPALLRRVDALASALAAEMPRP